MKTLKQLLNERGYKKLSSINPLILQSDVLIAVREWLEQKRIEALDRYATGEAYLLKELFGELEN